jgi:hypothetical protein
VKGKLKNMNIIKLRNGPPDPEIDRAAFSTTGGIATVGTVK